MPSRCRQFGIWAHEFCILLHLKCRTKREVCNSGVLYLQEVVEEKSGLSGPKFGWRDGGTAGGEGTIKP